MSERISVSREWSQLPTFRVRHKAQLMDVFVECTLRDQRKYGSEMQRDKLFLGISTSEKFGGWGVVLRLLVKGRRKSGQFLLTNSCRNVKIRCTYFSKLVDTMRQKWTAVFIYWVPTYFAGPKGHHSDLWARKGGRKLMLPFLICLLLISRVLIQYDLILPVNDGNFCVFYMFSGMLKLSFLQPF